jgi:hypothetical protein
MGGRSTKSDHKSSPCHKVTGELKTKTIDSPIYKLLEETYFNTINLIYTGFSQSDPDRASRL